MATVTLHYPVDPSRLDHLPDAELLTGLMIDHAAALGWSQGFDREDADVWSWQINEAHCMANANGTLVALTVSLPGDRSILPPFAGIAIHADAVLRRVGLQDPSSILVGFTPGETILREPERSEMLRRAPLGSEADALVTLYAAGPDAPVHADNPTTTAAIPAPSAASSYSPLLAGALEEYATDALTDPVVPAAHLPHLPAELAEISEHPSTPWHVVDAVNSSVSEWSPLLAGVLANSVMFAAQEAMERPDDATPGSDTASLVARVARRGARATTESEV